MIGDKPKPWYSELVPDFTAQNYPVNPLAAPTADFKSVRSQLISPPRYVDVALDTVRTDALQNALELNISGDSFYIDANPSDGAIQIEFQDSGSDLSSPRLYGSPGILFNFPFTKVKVYNTAQTGKKARIVYGSGLNFNPYTPASTGGGGGPSSSVDVLTMPPVVVSSMPAITGTVAVSSMPAISGTVAVSSIPAISGTVAVSSIPNMVISTMPAITGTVAVSSIPAITGTVTVTAQPAPAVLTYTQTVVAVAVTSTLLKAANAARKYLFIQNLGTGIVTLNMAGAAAVAGTGVRLVAATTTFTDSYRSQPGYCHGLLINAIATIAGNVLVIEGT